MAETLHHPCSEDHFKKIEVPYDEEIPSDTIPNSLKLVFDLRS